MDVNRVRPLAAFDVHVIHHVKHPIHAKLWFLPKVYASEIAKCLICEFLG